MDNNLSKAADHILETKTTVRGAIEELGLSGVSKLELTRIVCTKLKERHNEDVLEAR